MRRRDDGWDDLLDDLKRRTDAATAMGVLLEAAYSGSFIVAHKGGLHRRGQDATFVQGAHGPSPPQPSEKPNSELSTEITPSSAGAHRISVC